MTASEQIQYFVVGFYMTFIDPLFQLLNDTDVLGVPLFYWLFGLTVLSIGVNFVRRFFGSDEN